MIINDNLIAHMHIYNIMHENITLIHRFMSNSGRSKE